MSLKYLLLSAFTAISLSVNAQSNFRSTAATESITLSHDSIATVLDWFKVIEEKGIVLAYNSSHIDLTEKIQIRKHKLSVKELLENILRKYDYEADYTSASKILLQIKGRKFFVLSGRVTDRVTGGPLQSCTISLQGSDHKKHFSFTDASGRFSISLPIGKYRLKATYIGYELFSKDCILDRKVYVDIQMSETSFPLREAKVGTSPLMDMVNYKGVASALSVNDNDPFAQIHALPGIVGSSVSGDLHVNGGQNDENLILLDGLSVYHSHHNNTMLAQFNGDAVKKVSFFDSFIPAQYEGRLSSVTDVRIKRGDSLQHHQAIGLDLPSASLTFDGPIVKNKLTYMISGRHSWLDFMKDLFIDKPNTNRTFKDLTGKIFYQLNPNLSIEGLLYTSTNQYNDSIGDSRNFKILEWVNHLYSVACTAQLPKQISSSSSVSYTAYRNSIYAPVINIPAPIYIDESMKNVTVKSSFSKQLDDAVNLSWGFSVARERYNLLASQDTVDNDNKNVTQVSTFLNSKLRITDRLFGSAALNLVSYLPEKSRSFFSVQPRFTLKYMVRKRNQLFFDFSRMEQFYHNLCVGEIPIPTDLRMPSIDGFKPSSSVHSEMGWRHISNQRRIGISTFYKRRFHILGIRYDLVDTDIEGWSRFVMRGNAESYGVKVHCINHWNRWNLECNYTYSRSMEWFRDFDQNKKNPALHDVPHIFHCATSYQIAEHSFLSIGGYVKSGIWVNVYDEDNETGAFIAKRERKKTNYRLDFNFSSSKTSTNQRVHISYKLGLYNIVGNPKENEIIDLYSVDTRKHCLPYVTLNLRF